MNIFFGFILGLARFATRLAGAFPPGKTCRPSACPGTSYEVAGDDEHRLQALAYAPSCQMPWVRGISGKEIFKKEVEEILGK